jgi:class 3 adenylate cyclase
MRTENLAIVFTDIKGFTERTSRQTRAEHERLLKVHEMLLAPTFKAFGGNIRKTIGDAFLVTFESPTNAVLCGIAIQDRLFRFNQTAPEADRMEVRVAINIGEVRVEANDVFGEPVNVAARLEGVAEANEVYFTEAVYLVMNKAEVPSEEIGAFDFKGVPEKIRVFRVPRGPYRLTSGPLSNVPEPDLPYGGLGLARAEGLSPPDLVSIEKALAARQNRRANLHWLAERSRSLAEKVPGGKSTLMLGGVGTTLLLVLVLSLTMFSSPKVQKLIEAGEFNEAGALINQMPKGPERSYWDGRLQQKQSHWSAAVEDYGAAAQAKEFRHKAIDGLGEVAEHGDCDAKERVARKLGSIGDKYGSSILEKLAKESPEEPSGGVLGGLFGNPCDPAKAAAEAAKKLGDK